MPNVIRLTEPAAEPVTAAEAKAQLDITDTDDDVMIGTFISAARRRVEDYCQRPFVSATWAVLYDGALPGGDCPLTVPLADVAEITEVSYRGADGTAQIWAMSGNWSFDAERQEITPVAAWPGGTHLRIAATAGNDDSPLDIPAPVKVAILMFVADMYENREAGNDMGKAYEINPRATQLLDPYRERMGL